MDLVSFGFLGLVVILGGFVAYLADGLGRKLGKKRLSLMGLRPRHTATILTIGAGLLIPLLTVLALSVASSDFRQWLTEGRAAIVESRRLSARVQEQRKELQGLTERLNEANDKVGTAEGKLTRANDQLKSLDQRVKSLQADAKGAESRRAEAQAGLTQAKQSLTQTLARLDTVSNDLKDLRAQSQSLSQSFRLQQQDLEAAYDHNRTLTEDSLKLESANEKLRGEIAAFETKLGDLNKGIDAARSQLTEAQNKATEAANQLETKTKELTAVEEALRIQQQKLDLNVGISRTERLMFAINEEIVRVSLPANLLEVEAVEAVRRLQTTASRFADMRGAGTNPELGRSAGLFYRTDEGRTITIEEQEQALGKAMAGQRDEIVLVAYSALNSFQREFVALVIKPYRNPVVYRAGETIIEGRVDGSQADSTIYSQLSQLIGENLTPAAMRKGMIPRQNADGGFGQVSAERIFELVRQISTVGRTVRVTIVAAENTRAGDTLRVEFRLR